MENLYRSITLINKILKLLNRSYDINLTLKFIIFIPRLDSY